MGKVMLTVKLGGKSPSIGRVQRKLNLKDDDIDRDFGVVNIDPDKDLYAVLVEEEAAGQAGEREDVSGPFANPTIEDFGGLEQAPER